MQYIAKGTVTLGYIEDALGYLNLCLPVWKSLKTLFTVLTANLRITDEITKLKTTIASLTETVNLLQSSLKLTSEQPVASKPADVPSKVPIVETNQSHFIAVKSPAITSPNSTDRKFNIIMYGIKESPPKTSKADRLDHDLQCIVIAFAEVEHTVDISSIKDCFRLGKFKHDAQRPRPILIKFLRSTEVTMALLKIAAFRAPVAIKPDLTPEERNIESFLLNTGKNVKFPCPGNVQHRAEFPVLY